MSPTDHVIEVSGQGFQDLIKQSQQVPVLLEFYAKDARSNQQPASALQKLAVKYQGKFKLGRVDVQQNQAIVQQLGVRALPTVKVIFEGKMVHNLEGPQTETGLRKLIDELTMSPMEHIRAQIKLLLEQHDITGAITLLQEIIAQEPSNYGLQTELADLLIMASRLDEARQILAALPADADGINKPKNRIEFIDKAASFDDLATLAKRVNASPQDLTAKYQYAVRLVVDDQIEPALMQMLEMLEADKSFDDALAQRTMILIFELLGKGDALATRYRRRMFAFLH